MCIKAFYGYWSRRSFPRLRPFTKSTPSGSQDALCEASHMALIAYIGSVRKMADLPLTLLDTTLLQYCIFMGFSMSFLRFPSHVSFSVFFAYGLSRLTCGICAHFWIFCGFFSFFRIFFWFLLWSLFLDFLRFSIFLWLVFFFFSLCGFLAFFCGLFFRFLFAIASFRDENVNVIFNYKICAGC